MDKPTQQPTELELSQLKDELEQFKATTMWKLVLIYMQRLYADAAEEALAADDIAKVKWASGVAHAVKMISTFDDNIPVLRQAKESA